MPLFERLPEMLGLDDFDKRHKIAFVFLLCSIVLIIGLWFFQLQDNIELYGDAKSSSNQSAQSDPEAELKLKDTDTDGLNDYDELNTYKTSPYLADSDSDTHTDRDEIQDGTDPNCPEGKTCTAVISPSTVTPDFQVPSTVEGGAISGSVTPQSGGAAQLSAEEKAALQQLLGTENNTAALRSFLLQSGAEKSYLDSISDADLMTVINELLK